MPILALVLFVLAHKNVLHRVREKQNVSPRSVLLGLLLGCFGDYLLTSDDTFLVGVAAFGLGHIFYIR